MAADTAPSTSGRPPSRLDKIGPTGDGMVFYSSGNIAVVICKQPVGHIITIMSDNRDSQVLASFDARGVGAVNHPNGKPWLVVTEEGCTVSDRKGALVERSRFPRKNPEPLTFEVSEHVLVRFVSKQDIVVTFSCEDVVREWQCGEALRRSEPYTAKAIGSRQGKLELDVGAIRQRQKEVGSVYVPPGPHRQETERPGIGSLKKALRSLDPGSPLAATVSDLRSLDSRVGQIDTLPRVLYGTLRSTGRLGSSDALTDYGSPPMSVTQRRFKSTMRSVEYSKSNYKGRRLKLPMLSTSSFDRQVAGPGAPSDLLIVLCIFADWNPVCAGVEAQMEVAHGQFAEEAAANAGSESGHIKIYKVNASESNLLQDRYGFRSVPMFLMLYEGKLLFASNNVRTAAEMRDAALSALVRGRKKDFLPDGFKFGIGKDNELLDYIRPGMALREL